MSLIKFFFIVLSLKNFTAAYSCLSNLNPKTFLAKEPSILENREPRFAL